ncbi:hypothetical protein FEM48_Zijuj12G0017300 [Ziziphus jujuba var. spinosa]|uniref:Uncharacterized protein n=1 Tax=Ziziphus jujuba var. spinosa TaxID=714518 RepID=A0A978UAH0_ZIZJJ|nr:hypothetical protein FEM48_Zijuj12G0017300 [Ziziphus jujuba var. spinosa]
MAMPWGMTLWMAKMVWIALAGWVSSCLTVADEVAGSLRTGDIGPFHMVLVRAIGGSQEFIGIDICPEILLSYNFISGVTLDNLRPYPP